MTAATGAPTPGDAVWEPVRIEDGTQVRIRLSSECHENWGAEGIVEAHPQWAEGMTGRAFHHGERKGEAVVCSLESLRRHPYLVVLDDWAPGGTWALRMAASELIAIAARPGAVDGER
jgi:hypothetical protein